MKHGTVSSYSRGCRCDLCRAEKAASQREYMSGRRSDRTINRALLAEALQEMFPDGLTDDCPARRQR